MTVYRQTNAGGVNGATVAAGSGGSADGSTPYDSVNVGGTLVYAASPALYPGGHSVTTETTTSALSQVTLGASISKTTPMAVSLCCYMPATAAGWYLLEFVGTGVTNMCGLVVTNAMHIAARNTSNSNTDIGTVTIPLNSWFRVEMKLIAASTTVGQYEFRTFLDPFSAVPDEVITSPATRNTGVAGAPTAIRYGISVPQGNAGPYSFTYAQASDSGTYPPPPLAWTQGGAPAVAGFQAAVRRSVLY